MFRSNVWNRDNHFSPHLTSWLDFPQHNIVYYIKTVRIEIAFNSRKTLSALCCKLNSRLDLLIYRVRLYIILTGFSVNTSYVMTLNVFYINYIHE